MDNIFENAYFGKAYKTDKGNKAYYQKFAKTYFVEGIKECAAFPNVHILFTSNDIILADSNGIAQNLNSFNNIVSEWQERVDENRLDKLSKEYSLWLADEPLQEQRYIDGFKDGYKASKKGE